MTSESTTLIRALLGGNGWDSALARLASAIVGHEDKLFLHGARDFPLPAAVARPIQALMRAHEATAEQAASMVTILMATRGVEPRELRMCPLTEQGVTAIHGGIVSVDDDEFFLQDAGQTCNTLWRTVRVLFQNPEAAFEAWGVGQTDWARQGVFQLGYYLSTNEDQTLRADQYPVMVAKWGARTLPPVPPMFPPQIGCELGDLSIGWVPSGSQHPFRLAAEKQGLVEPNAHALILVLQPTLSALALEDQGPHLNNAWAGDLESLVASCNTPYTWACRMAGVRAMEHNPKILECSGLAEVALEALSSIEPLTRGAWVGEDPDLHAPHLSGGLSLVLAGEVAGWLAVHPSQGPGFVAEFIKECALQNCEGWLEAGLTDGAPYLTGVAFNPALDSTEKYPFVGMASTAA